MTNVNRRLFDELAHCLRVNKTSNALILQLADVLNRNTANFKRDWWIDEAGYVTPGKPTKVLKLGARMKVVPTREEYGEYYETPSVPEIGAHKGRGMRLPGWEEDRAAIAQQERILDMLDPPTSEAQDPASLTSESKCPTCGAAAEHQAPIIRQVK